MVRVCQALVDETLPASGYRSAAGLMADTVNGILADGPEALEHDGVPAWSLVAVLELVSPAVDSDDEWPEPAALQGAVLVAILISDQLEDLEREATAQDVRKAVVQTEELASLLP